MIQVKHIVAYVQVVATSNPEYRTLEQKINKFIVSLPLTTRVVDIKYSSVFKEVNEHDVQYSALILYDVN